MKMQNQTHPSPRQLAALVLGKLKPESQARLQEHMASCSICSNFVSNTPRATLIALWGEAGSATSASDQSTPGIRDAGTLGGISSAAKLGRQPASRPPQSKQNALIAGGPNEDTPERRLADDEIPQALREQTKYRILRLLGRGGMGSVYEAHHERMDRRVAIKTINPSLIDHPEALKRFDQEVKAAAKLDHTNVARAYDADEFGSMRVLVMEFVPGQSLDKFLAQRKQLSVMEACRLVRQAMVGLQHAHERGMVHRDLKPQNLMLTPDGKVKILDFGLAKIASERHSADGLTRENALMGTPHYLAPEQALDAAKADIRADIYSLGCTLYCLLAGSPPFDGDTEMKVLLAHQNDAPRPLCEVRPDVPLALSELVDRMLAKNPTDRPQTPKETAQALLAFAKSENVVSDKPVPHVLAFLDAPSETIARPTLTSLAPPTKPPGIGFWSFAGAGLLLAMLFAAWLAGVFSLRTPEGTIIIENVPHDAEILVDGHTITVSRAGEVVTIDAVSEGEHRLKLVQGNKAIWTSDVTVTVGGQPVRARYERLATPSSPDSHGTPTNAVAPPNLPMGAPIDALSLVRLPEDALRGVWQKTSDGLRFDTAGEATLQIPYQPIGEYQFRVRFTPLAENGIYHFALSHHDKQFGCGIDDKVDPPRTTIGLFNGNTFIPFRRQKKLAKDHVQTVVVVVADDSITVKLDGEEIVWKKIDYSNIILWWSKTWNLKPGSLGINTTTPLIIHSVEVIPGNVSSADQGGASDTLESVLPDLPAGEDTTSAPPATKHARVIPLANQKFPSGVIFGEGTWQIDHDELVLHSTTGERTLLAFGDPSWARYNIELDAKTDNNIKICFNFRSDAEFRMLGLEPKTENFLRSQFGQGWGQAAVSPNVIQKDHWYKVRIEVRGEQSKCLLNGKSLFGESVVEKHHLHGRIALGGKHSVVRFRNIKVTDENGKTVLWEGFPVAEYR
jgi:serine/threonine protein kinase